jgi:hypothetical protein
MVEANSGAETAELFTCHVMEIAFARRGAAFALLELTHSAKVRDAIAPDMAQNQ